MSVRLVAVDLDGTLVARWRPATPRVRAALDACRRAGIAVVAVTARRWEAAAPLLNDLPVGDVAIVAGGTELRRLPDGRLLDTRLLPAGVVAAACAAIRGAGLQPMVASGRGFLVAGRADGVAAARYLQRAGVTRRPQAALAVASTRVLAMGPRSRVEVALRACAGMPARLLVQDCIVPLDASGEVPTELHVAAADKGDGLRAVCARLGIPPGQTLAVGDAPSDLPMLAAAGVAVVMGQSPAGLRRPGYVVAPDVHDDGCAWAIERLVLGQRSRRGSTAPRR